jgi:hypothetical protein
MRLRPSAAAARSLAVLAAATVLVLAPAACTAAPASADISTGQMLVELGDALNGIRHDNALLQAQIDSLRTEVARQDTLLARLANLAGVPR